MDSFPKREFWEKLKQLAELEASNLGKSESESNQQQEEGEKETTH